MKSLFILLVLFFASCENNVEEEDELLADVEVIDSCADISFASNIRLIIDNSCVECHNGGQFPDLRTYNGVSNSAQSVQVRVVNRTMPLGGSLSNEEIEMIRCWVENGALNN